MTEGKSVSAHRAQGPTPCKGCCPPRRWVRGGSLPPLTHRRGEQHPLQGVLPLCTVGRDRFPLSHKQTPSSLLQHSKFMTEVTSMTSVANKKGRSVLLFR